MTKTTARRRADDFLVKMIRWMERCGSLDYVMCDTESMTHSYKIIRFYQVDMDADGFKFLNRMSTFAIEHGATKLMVQDSSIYVEFADEDGYGKVQW